MSTYFILSQVFVVLNYLLMAFSYVFKKRVWILLFSFLSLIANAVSYLFLSAWTGLAMVCVALLRNIIFLVQNKNDDKSTKITKADWVVLVVLYAISIGIAIFTYDGILSLFSVLATMLFTFSIWQKNTLVYNVLGIFVSMTWIIYDAFIWSPFAIVCEICMMTFMIVTLIIKLMKRKKEKLNGEQIKNIKNAEKVGE